MSEKKTSGCLPALGLLAVLGVAVGYCNSRTSTQNPAQDQQRNDFGQIRVLCQEAIKGALKNPSGAKLPRISLSEDIGVAAEDPETYRVRTYADAPNDFGVEVRTNFQCDCKKIDGRWQVVALDTY